MTVRIVYGPELARYRLSPSHPLRPERAMLAVELARAWGFAAERGTEQSGQAAIVPPPAPAGDAELEIVHDPGYISAVRKAGAAPQDWFGPFGIGAGDTPPFPDMHEASAQIVAATTAALADIADGRVTRAFCPAGGLHHAHRDHAAGFCVYNDVAVAIASAVREHPGLRVAYVDVDVHHGDGVQEAFYKRKDVLTISVHESGSYLFPGTGRTTETGIRDAVGFAVNLPLPPGAGDECYSLAFERVIAPAVRTFAPGIIVAQLGADTHRDDPLAHIATTVRGQYRMAQSLVKLAEEVCDGRILATGGGGYDAFSATPRAWACAIAALLGAEPPETLPESWRALAAESAAAAGVRADIPTHTFQESETADAAFAGSDPLGETERAIERLLEAHPLFTRAR